MFEYFIKRWNEGFLCTEPQVRAVGVGIALKIGQLSVSVQLYEKAGRIYLWTDSAAGLGLKPKDEKTVELLL